jgi:hypothetical protein
MALMQKPATVHTVMVVLVPGYTGRTYKVFHKLDLYLIWNIHILGMNHSWQNQQTYDETALHD